MGIPVISFSAKPKKDFDQFLENLGAQRLVERLDADVDYQAAATEWRKQVLSILKDELTGAAAVTSVATFAVSQTAESHYSKEQPYTASLSTSQKLLAVIQAKMYATSKLIWPILASHTNRVMH